ncbi:MAG: DUF2235 domain-containing protein [Pseudomonadota bacterium]
MTQPSFLSRLYATIKSRLRLHPAPDRGEDALPRNHVIVIDGTQSRQTEGDETNAGLLYKLLLEACDDQATTVWYHPGIQGHGFWNWVTIASGWGINQLIFDGYSRIARHYRPGDKIFLFGYSRGAYAVRSIAGMIGEVGLVHHNSADEENLRLAFSLYETGAPGNRIRDFQILHCHNHVPIEMIGVWDTVKALGLSYPLLTYLAPMATEFHSLNIGHGVKAGYQALALHEDRTAYRPVLWQTEPGWDGTLEQVWFRGAHGDVGGHVWATPSARPLANIPLQWMAKRAEAHGLKLPPGWQDRHPGDPRAPMQGARSGIAKFFLLRQPRKQGEFPGEAVHPAALEAEADTHLPVAATPASNPIR